MKWLIVSILDNRDSQIQLNIEQCLQDELNLSSVYLTRGKYEHIAYSLASTRDSNCTVFIDGAVAIVGDIDIHNRAELSELLQIEYKIEQTDELLINELYKKYGIYGAKYILGEFSFLLIDFNKMEAYLVRDQIGIKTLFWLKNSLGIFIASDLFLLKPYYNFTQLDFSYFSDFLDSGGYLDTQKTPFRHVYRVESASIVRFTNNTETNCKYWDLSELPATSKYKDECLYIEQFKDIFTQAVSRRLSRQESNGIMLSGGLDSTSIFVSAKKQKDIKLKTFSVVFDELKDGDEREYFEELLQKYDSSGSYINLDNHLHFNRFPQNIPFSYEPSVNSLTFEFAYYLIREATLQGCTNILSGFGGDQLLTGSNYAVKDIVYQGQIVKALKYLADYSIYTNSSAVQNTKKYIVKADITSNFYHKQSAYYQKINGKIKKIKDYYKKEIYLQLQGVQAHTYTDRLVGGLFGSDVKHPFLDRQLIEFVYNLPVNLIYHPLYSKKMLRTAFSQELTTKITQRINKTTHLQYTFRSLKENWVYIEKLNEHPYVVEKLHLVSKENWIAYMAKWRNGLDTTSDFYILLAIEVWFRKYYERLEVS